MTSAADAKRCHHKPHKKLQIHGKQLAVGGISNPVDCIPGIEPNCPLPPEVSAGVLDSSR
jgi:hypothetical protein